VAAGTPAPGPLEAPVPRLDEGLNEALAEVLTTYEPVAWCGRAERRSRHLHRSGQSHRSAGHHRGPHRLPARRPRPPSMREPSGGLAMGAHLTSINGRTRPGIVVGSRYQPTGSPAVAGVTHPPDGEE
jgi:hypothetical protein